VFRYSEYGPLCIGLGDAVPWRVKRRESRSREAGNEEVEPSLLLLPGPPGEEKATETELPHYPKRGDHTPQRTWQLVQFQGMFGW